MARPPTGLCDELVSGAARPWRVRRATHIADGLGHDSPTLHLRRSQDDGLFDQYARHVEWWWEQARPE